MTYPSTFIALHARAKDLSGLIFGRLAVLGPVGRNSTGKLLWVCRCECGNQSTVCGEHLRSGHTRSCGCLQRQVAADHLSEQSRTHGLSHLPVHRTWLGMKARCTDLNNDSYVDYGGRGITVCAEWMTSFEAFYDHVTALPHFGEDGRSLDRIDNDRDYEPGNVQWATAEMQRRNQRRSVRISIDGETLTVADWAQRMGIRARTIRYRLAHGWLPRDAVLKPSQRAEYAQMAQAAIAAAVR